MRDRKRTELLEGIENRLRAMGVLYDDIWARLFLTPTEILEQIAASDLEGMVSEASRKAAEVASAK